MAGFGFSEAQEMWRREVRLFAQRELAPGARERTQKGILSREIIRKMGEWGLLALNVPSQYGGQPADWVSVGIAVEELGRVDMVPGFMVPLPSVLASIFSATTEEAMRQEWLPPLARGERILAMGVTEPGSGSDAAAMKTTAIKEGEHYILHGSKAIVDFGQVADAVILFAKTSPLAGPRGISAFLLPLDTPNLSRRPVHNMGMKGLVQASVQLDGVRLPASHLLVGEGKGFIALMKQFDILRVCVAMVTLGQAQVSLEEAITYTQQRHAFGQPLAKYEGVSFKIAEDATLVEAARLLCYRALWLRDQGLVHTRETAMCKSLAPRAAVRTIHDALLIHGHSGYSTELPLEQRLRDVMGMQIADGPVQIMNLIIARELLGKDFVS